MYGKLIDYDVCSGCMECMRSCAICRVIEQNPEGLPEFKNDFMCIGCGHCLAVCPRQAIRFEYDGNAQQQDKQYVAGARMMKEAWRDFDGDALLEFLASVRSERYYTSRLVEPDKAKNVLEAIVRAPSGGNEQNRNIYVYDDKPELSQIEEQVRDHYQRRTKAFKNPQIVNIMAFLFAGKGKKALGPQATYAEGRSMVKKLLVHDTFSSISFLRNAPVLVVVTSDPKRGMHRPFYKADTAIAITYATFAAKAMGLSTCWIGLLEIAMKKNKNLRGMMGIKNGEIVTGAFVLGYSDTIWKQLPPRGPVKVVWKNGDIHTD